MNWEEVYQKGDAFWNKGAPSPPMQQYLERNAVRGRTLVPGCGHGHEVALAVKHGLEATGLEIAPTGVVEARALYPQLADRFVVGNLFEPPEEMRRAFDFVLEHTCMSGLHPSLHADYRRGIDFTLKRGGLVIGVQGFGDQSGDIVANLNAGRGKVVPGIIRCAKNLLLCRCQILLKSNSSSSIITSPGLKDFIESALCI